MADWGFTNKPNLGAGVFGHHLITRWNINQSAMLQSMHLTNALNLRDFSFNGVPLTGAISAADTAGSALHLSNHPDLRPYIHQNIIVPIQEDWLARVRVLELDDGLSLSEAERVASAEFAPSIKGITAVLRTGTNPLVDSSGNFIDFQGNILTSDDVMRGGWYTPLTEQDPIYVRHFAGVPLEQYYAGFDISTWSERIDFQLAGC